MAQRKRLAATKNVPIRYIKEEYVSDTGHLKRNTLADMKDAPT